MSFDHEAHLALAFDALSAGGLAGAMATVPRTLAELAASHGQPEKYHQTRTIMWLLVVADRMARSGETSLEGLLQAHPELRSSDLVDREYTPETLRSESARRDFLLPSSLSGPPDPRPR